MNIALLGYGKMGKIIEQIALERGHNIVTKVNETPQKEQLRTVNVAIDFSTPQAAFDNIKICLENNVKVVSGTTGWLDKYQKAISLCKIKNNGFIYASNFSIGVNIFFSLNQKLAKIMTKYKEEYPVEIQEVHHTQKLDAPSGTAITLADAIIQRTDYESWYLKEESSKQMAIPIISKREGTITGTHTVNYNSDIDSIQIKHTAHNRQGFALGAVIAAEWLQNKTGVFNMKDVLELED